MLDARELRFRKKLELAALSGLPVVSITVNVPYASRHKLPYILFHYRMSAAFRQELERGGLMPGGFSFEVDADGPFATFTVNADPLDLKRLSTAFEEETPRGRLLDIDVLSGEGELIDRTRISGKLRTCIVCGNGVHECIVGKKHSYEALMQKVEELLYDAP